MDSPKEIIKAKVAHDCSQYKNYQAEDKAKLKRLARRKAKRHIAEQFELAFCKNT